jgi:hypothetical protein
MNMQKSIRNEEIRLNETNASNNLLQRNIDTHRKELISTSKMIKNMNKGIDKARKEAKKKNEQYVDQKKKSEETNDQVQYSKFIQLFIIVIQKFYFMKFANNMFTIKHCNLLLERRIRWF